MYGVVPAASEYKLVVGVQAIVVGAVAVIIIFGLAFTEPEGVPAVKIAEEETESAL